ncbi:MAG: acyl carrier protein [Erysipelothrix sp.]|nr:acyl carrier protein [Erysipelothrix sp.]
MFEKVRTIISQLMRIDLELITLETHLRDDLNFDSLMILELVLELESELDIEIEDAEVATFTRVADVVKILETK